MVPLETMHLVYTIHCIVYTYWLFHSFIHFISFRALKDQGYESDSTLIFRKRDTPYIAPLSPVEQKQAYLNMQAGGEAPIQGFRKPAPEKPRGMCVAMYCFCHFQFIHSINTPIKYGLKMRGFFAMLLTQSYRFFGVFFLFSSLILIWNNGQKRTYY